MCLPGGFVGVNLSREGNGSLGLVVLRGRMTLSRLFVRRMMAREKRRILPRKWRENERKVLWIFFLFVFVSLFSSLLSIGWILWLRCFCNLAVARFLFYFGQCYWFIGNLQLYPREMRLITVSIRDLFPIMKRGLLSLSIHVTITHELILSGFHFIFFYFVFGFCHYSFIYLF